MATVACITAYFNPAGYRSRRENYATFAEALDKQGIPLFTVELALDDDPFELEASPNVFQVRGGSRLWMKERLLNVAVSRLPKQCTAFAWLDSDLLFADSTWFCQLDRLLETNDIVQLFERVVHLPPGHRRYQGDSLGDDTGVAAQATLTPDWLAKRRARALPFAVPGYAWAARRSFLAEAGLYDRAIVGNGDAILTDCLFNSLGIHHYSSMLTAAMTEDIELWRRRTLAGRSPRVGYLPVDVYHLWHGSFVNRQYCARDEILLRHQFDPVRDLALDGDLYVWASEKPALHTEVAAYFAARREDGD